MTDFLACLSEESRSIKQNVDSLRSLSEACYRVGLNDMGQEIGLRAEAIDSSCGRLRRGYSQHLSDNLEKAKQGASSTLKAVLGR